MTSKGNDFVNKEIYERAFKILKTQNEMCSKLESVGLRFEYGDGFVGKTLESLISDAEAIVLEALGLHEMPKDMIVRISGADLPTTIEVLYTEENDPDWSITMDDFCEFFYQAINNKTVRDLMWNAMVNKDVEAKEKYNALKHGRIGEAK